MDGVGGVLKRTADQHVARGNDISSVTDFVAHLKISCPGVDLDELLPEDINRKKLLQCQVTIILFLSHHHHHHQFIKHMSDAHAYTKN